MSRILTMILLIGSLAGDLRAQVSALDREMLLSFYQSTNGPRWLQSSGWNGPPGTECTWYGVTCAQGAVTGLQLPDNNLGEVDATHPFAFLLPVEPVNLRELTVLNLAGNRFEQIVPNAYGNFPRLVWLDLGRLRLNTALPAQLGNVTTLQSLFLDRNQFTGPLPEAWSNLTQLRNLVLTDNALSGPLPASWSAMRELRSLDLSDDPTTFAPDGDLQGPIPASWGQLVKLQTLRLAANRIDGAIPDTLGNLVDLRTLDLSQNQLQGNLPGTLGALTALEFLSVASNRLEGPIPESFAALRRLAFLLLFDNEFNGSLPAGLANLTALEWLLLQQNELVGSFPTWTCALPKLERLVLTRNRFSGRLPACLGQLTGLRKLGLGTNAFRGEVPPSLVQLTELVALPDNALDEGHLFFNAVWSEDPAVLAFIEARFPRGNLVPEFIGSQTLPPGALQIEAIASDAVRLRWEARGQIGNGHFQIVGAASDTLFCDGFDAPCLEPALLSPTIEIETSSRSIVQQDIGGLVSGQRYRFVVFSVSEPRADLVFPLFDQPNRIVSDPSAVVGLSLP